MSLTPKETLRHAVVSGWIEKALRDGRETGTLANLQEDVLPAVADCLARVFVKGGRFQIKPKEPNRAMVQAANLVLAEYWARDGLPGKDEENLPELIWAAMYEEDG